MSSDTETLSILMLWSVAITVLILVVIAMRK